jgi:pimeloyl-ACP methyl ester carboxylesterase
MTRRQVLRALAAMPVSFAGVVSVRAQANRDVAYGGTTLPAGIRSRLINNINGITYHILEAGFEGGGRPCVLLIHGYPELAYSWRRVIPPLARAGFHVVAPDLRGFGRSGGTDVTFDDDLAPFTVLNKVRDMLALLSAIGYRSVVAVVGHDHGSGVAGACALARPDVFKSVVLMSAPFGGAPAPAFNTANDGAKHTPSAAAAGANIDDDLAKLPVPRKYYQTYYTTRPANENMWHPPQGIHNFLRAYYHFKSADWKENKPFPLKANTAGEMAKLPRYYVMDLKKGMAETVAPEMPSASAIAACKWLPEEELRVYSSEYGRTGFQGGLNSYRVNRNPKYSAELQLFAGRTIDVPSAFIAGKSDWGPYQRSGAVENMRTKACTQMRGVHFLDGAGHWVQQEQDEAVTRLLIEFLHQV